MFCRILPHLTNIIHYLRHTPIIYIYIYSLSVLPGYNFWKACIRMGGSLRNEKKWYLAITLGQQQQQLCTEATRRLDGPWSHGDVIGSRIRIKLALCVFDILSYCWLMRHFAHLLTTCTTLCYSGLRPHPRLVPRVAIHPASSGETTVVEDTIDYVLCGC